MLTTTVIPYTAVTVIKKKRKEKVKKNAYGLLVCLIRHDVLPSFCASPPVICLRPLGSCLLPHFPANRAFHRVSHYLFQSQFHSIHHLVARMLVRPVHSCPSSWPTPICNFTSHLVRLPVCPKRPDSCSKCCCRSCIRVSIILCPVSRETASRICQLRCSLSLVITDQISFALRDMPDVATPEQTSKMLLLPDFRSCETTT